jgi:A/G-specific adenine glycosylase
MQRAPTPLHAAKLSDHEWMTLVAGLGYYRRFRMLRESLVQLTGGGLKDPIWPKSKLEWLQGGGVGEYTSSAISSIAFGEKCIVIDGNVERVMARFLGTQQMALGSKELKDAIRLPLEKYISTTRRPGDFNQALMQLGQMICTPSSPRCISCPLASNCFAKLNSLQSFIPLPKKRKERVEFKLKLLIPTSRDKNDVGIVLRSPKAKFLRGIPGFLTLVKSGNRWKVDGVDHGLSFDSSALISLGTFRHSITHHDLSVEVACLPMPSKSKKHVGECGFSVVKWEALHSGTSGQRKIDDLGFLASSLDKKALKIFESFVEKDRTDY